MATREEIYQAIRNADAAGDSDSVSKLAGYLQTLPSATPASQPAPTQEPSLTDRVARQVGLTARAGVMGALALPGMIADVPSAIYNKGADLVAGEGNGYRFPTTQRALDQNLTALGLPEPANSTERIVQDAASSMVGAGASVKLANALAGAQSPIVREVANKLAAGPGMQVVSAGSGGASGGAARESGAGPLGQLTAAMLGGSAPSVGLAAASAGLRGLMRGGEEGRQAVQNNIDAFRKAGTTPTVGQATQARFPRAVESVLAKTPGGAGPMVTKAEQQANDLSNTVSGVADSLSPKASAFNAGESIAQGAQGFKEGFKQIQKKLYDNLDQYLPSQTPVNVSRTQNVLEDLNADIPGAPNLSQWFKNSKIQGIDAAMEADLKKAAQGGALPYEAIKKLRTLVGQQITDNNLVSDVPRSKWTALYGALSDDLGDAAKKAGPQAEGAWQWANQYTKSQLGRLEQLDKVVGKDAPEQVFQAAMSGTAEGDTLLKRVVSAVPKDNRKDLAAAVVQRLGKATPGKQDDLGGAFSSETFLTNWNRLSPEAKQTLFGRLGADEVLKKLQSVASVSSNVREGSKVFANPSGTAPALSAQNTGLGIALSMLTGHPVTAAGMAAVPVGANLLAKKMTDPSFVNWLAQKNSVSPALAPAELNLLSQYIK